MTNESLYYLTDQAMLREYQFKFTGHCNRMLTDEPTIRFVIYESKIVSSLRQDTPRIAYLNQVSSHILPGEKTFEANEIRKMQVNKSELNFRKKHPDRSSRPK